MKLLTLKFIIVFIYLISSSPSYAIQELNLKNLVIHKNPKKVITASTGNHGAACSLAMSLKGVDGSIYVPKNAHQNKIDKIHPRLKLSYILLLNTEDYLKL